MQQYYCLTSVTRAYGRDFTITVEMQKYSPALYNMHNIVVWKYELYLQSKQTSRVPYTPNKLTVLLVANLIIIHVPTLHNMQ